MAEQCSLFREFHLGEDFGLAQVSKKLLCFEREWHVRDILVYDGSQASTRTGLQQQTHTWLPISQLDVSLRSQFQLSCLACLCLYRLLHHLCHLSLCSCLCHLYHLGLGCRAAAHGLPPSASTCRKTQKQFPSAGDRSTPLQCEVSRHPIRLDKWERIRSALELRRAASSRCSCQTEVSSEAMQAASTLFRETRRRILTQ